MAAGTLTRRRLLERGGAAAVAAMAARPVSAAAAAKSRNVVVLVLDTLRVDHVYGPRAQTPNIDALMARGVSFTKVFPEAMPTVPARNSILSGRREFPFRNWREYPDLYPQPGWEPPDNLGGTFTSVLRRAGYWTACATDNPFLGYARPYGPFRRSFDAFAGTRGQLGKVVDPKTVSEAEVRRWLHPSIESRGTRGRLRKYLANASYADDETQSFAAQVYGDAIRLLETGAGRRPFALVVDTFQPHEPWTPPRNYLELYADPDEFSREPSQPPYSRVRSYLKGTERETIPARMQALYAAELTMTDRWLGTFLARLRELDLESETAIVLVADHGIYFGEHGWTGKISTVLHPELIQVPLVVVDPAGRKAGTTSDYRASTHDVGPTALSMAGVAVPESMEGADLSRLFEGRRLPRRPYSTGGYRNTFYIRDGDWSLTADNRLRDLELFNLRADPGEHRNVAAQNPAVVRRLRRAAIARAGGKPPFYAT
ncbi:MAG: sulfatase-like hydrolase/transferase [Actinomycetota bacterium]|nr:sulfatase-like hydrolase/transferase [Actinomycetota bacterium]